MRHPFLDILAQRVLILDGAMGTGIHRYRPSAADWGGDHLINLSDAVSLTHPEWIKEIHRSFLAAGCDAVETNTFNGSRHVLAEFGMGDRCRELSRLGAQLARQCVDEFHSPERPRFAIGSIGPGTKMPSILQESIYITFDDLAAAYRDHIRGLIEGGVDVLLIETCFDILQAKTVVITALDVMRELGVRLPLIVQITIQPDGRMLPGTEVAAALTTLDSFSEIDVLGLNCSVGPDLMLSAVRQLSQNCTRPISVVPNAGLPEKRGEDTHFPLQPIELADWLERFVTELGLNIVGGCCGTTSEHLALVCKRLANRKPAPRSPQLAPAVSSLLSAVDLRQEPRPLLVGERTNTNGSKKFKQLLEKDDWHGLVEMAQEQEREGVHVLDVCTAYVGRDEVRDMNEVIRRYNAILTKPLMIDSTEVPVIEASLKLISGKAIINSINLEDGRTKIDKVVPLAKRFGAALVALTIDEKGQADTAEWKFEVAKRIYDICVGEYGIPPTDLLFDPLVFPLTTGQEQTRKSAIATFEAIKLIKTRLPGALTHVGLSNASFGLSPYARQVLNSMYLHVALEYGLDSAILHASKILPVAQIDQQGQEICRRLLFDDRSAGDPLQQLIEHYGDKKADAARKSASLGETTEERLKQAIIQGRRETLIADLDTARQRYSPIDVINKVLLEGMKVVGDLFGSGQMQLPFVLQSAEVMKAAVAYLEQFMEKVEGAEKGRIVLATVKGDVHDIGKNLVDIILSNNGYRVFNLGIKQPIETMITAYQEHGADAIGMSGLLVKSTVVMKEDLVTLNERGLSPTVILGGAALNRRYVEDDLRRIYAGTLYYGEDAFDGLRIMDGLAAKKKLQQVGSAAVRSVAAKSRPAAVVHAGPTVVAACRSTRPPRGAPSTTRSDLPPAPNIPQPPFWGSRIVRDIPLADVYPFINERTLIGKQWQFRKSGASGLEYERQMREIAYPTLERLKRLCAEEKILRPEVAYGFFPCRSEGNDLIILRDDRATEWLRFSFPRQDHADGLCLSDYFSEESDAIALMAVTVGHEVSRRAKALFEADRYTDYLYLHGLGVETAEALAEYWHKHVRMVWGIGGNDAADIARLLKKDYRGCRYSFGYPACPDLEEQVKLFELLEPQRIGLALSEQFQLEPEQSTTALIVHHPAARYFNITR
jgi:5-methyltetrahydrofolate--homocysteine methyltransferase